MFLRHITRKKNGKEHRYWSVVENKRLSGGRVVQRAVLYLGEINSSQERAWRKSIEVLDEGASTQPRTLALFPEERCETWCLTNQWSAYGSDNCNCCGHASGALAGWP